MLMTIFFYLLMVIEILSSVLLIGIILLQKPRSQGAGMAFGAGMGESLFGSQVGNVLTRTTVVLAIIFLVNTTLLAVLGSARRGQTSVTDKMRTPAAMPAPMTPQPMPAPEAPANEGLPDAGFPPVGVPSAVETVEPAAAAPAVSPEPAGAPPAAAGKAEQPAGN